jgi:hypothetical protein
LAIPTEIPQAGSGPMNGCSDPIFANWSGISFPTMPACPGTHISWTSRKVTLTTLTYLRTELSPSWEAANCAAILTTLVHKIKRMNMFVA